MFRVWEQEDSITINNNNNKKLNTQLSKVSKEFKQLNPLILLQYLHTILEQTFSTDTSWSRPFVSFMGYTQQIPDLPLGHLSPGSRFHFSGPRILRFRIILTGRRILRFRITLSGRRILRFRIILSGGRIKDLLLTVNTAQEL